MKAPLALITIAAISAFSLTEFAAGADDSKMLYFASFDIHNQGDFCKNPEYFTGSCSWAELGSDIDDAKRKFEHLCKTNFKEAIDKAECKCEFDDQADSNGKNGRKRPRGMKTPRFNKAAKAEASGMLLWRVDEENSAGGFGGWIDGKPNSNSGMVNISCENIQEFLPKK